MPKRHWVLQPHFDTFSEPRYRPYVVAVGQVALAWNDLYKVLAFFFVVLHGEKVPSDVPLAVWNSSKSDRAQRDMLAAAAKTFLMLPDMAVLYPTGAADVKWLVDWVNRVEDARNNAVHSPLAIEGRGQRIMVVPDSSTGHGRAKNLEVAMTKRELLAEFRLCRDTACALRDYAWRMYATLCGEGPWPDRPRLPNRGTK
jgi:hypothetical protein